MYHSNLTLPFLDHFLSPCIINSRYVKDLTIRSDNLDLIEEKVVNTFEPTGTGKDFLNRTSISRATKTNN